MTSILSGAMSTNRRMSRFELSETVRTRVARRAASADRRARVAEREPVRQILRKHQMDAVVDRHDRPAADERRQHVVRRVKQRDAFAPAAPAGSSPARRASSCRRSPATGRKFSPSDASARAILGPAEQHELGVAVQPRQLPQQVPDVGADAEVVQLSGVDADAHGGIITAGRQGAGSQAGRERRRRASPYRSQPE